MRKVLSVILAFVLLISIIPVDSLNIKVEAVTTVPKATQKLSTPLVGIDVSSWNEEIDWAKVKAAGVEFAIVRMFHHIKNTPNYELDEQFERNVREAQKYGIQLGVYFFSYAQTLSAVTAEANMVVNELKKYPGVFSFPVVFDAEDGDTTDDPNVSGNDIYDIADFAGEACQVFCDILAENGYYPMVYSYAWYFEANIGMSNVKDYDLWLASYPKSGGTQIYACTGPANAGNVDESKREKLSAYDSNVTMWQYTGAGKIDGIYAGDGGPIVDLNLCYVNYPQIIQNGGYNGYEKGSYTFTTTPLVYRTGANGPASTYLNSKYYDHVTSIGLTGDGVTDTLAVALSQLGYYEGTASNPYGGLYNTWDEYTSNKTTEYVYNYGDADSSGYKMAWCASFCSWAIYQSQTADHATHDESCRENQWDEEYIWRECSCYQWADQLKRFDLYSSRGTYTPKTGDLIFFKMDGGGTAWTNHIGLVLYCDGERVYTVEGNRHNHVLLTDYSLSDTQICGYGKLPYPTNASAPKVDYSGVNKTVGQYITNNVTLGVSKTKGGAASFTVGKYEMFDVTDFDGGYALVNYKGNTGYAVLNSNTIQVTATKSTYLAQGMNATVDASSVEDTSFAGGTAIPVENNNEQNPNVLVTGLREDTNSYKGLENYGSNKAKIMINGRTWEKWESRSGDPILENIWIYGTGDGKAYLGIDIADNSRLRVRGGDGTGEEIETIVITRGFEIVKTTADLWDGGEIDDGGTNVGSVVGTFKENVILVANDAGGFDVYYGGSDDLNLEGYTFRTAKPQLVRIINDANIRSGPDASHPSIGVGLPDDTFEYLDEIRNTKWLKVDYKGQVGWISNVNAEVIDEPQYVILTADANIRSGPDASNASVGVGLEGDTFEYLNEIQNTKWLKVSYNGSVGWISNVNAILSELDEVVIVTALNADWEEPKTLTGISVVTPPTKQTYLEGETLNLAGMTVQATYSDQSTAPITDYTVSGYSSTPGTKTITVTYGGKTATFNVTVTAKSLTGITVVTPPTKQTYLEGESLNTAGLTVRANYNNNTNALVTDYTISGYSSTPGTKTVTVTYSGKTATFNVTVTTKSLTGITVVTPPTKQTYLEGESLNTAGLTVRANYNNNTNAMVTDFTVSGYSSTPGSKTITVTYGGKTATFNVTVTAKSLTGISITTKPTKLTYTQGESLNTAGLVVKATYNNGTSANVTGYAVTGYDANKVGQQTVTVTYSGKTATFAVTVNARVPSAITSSEYTVSGSYLREISIGTKVSELINGINEKQYIKVFQGEREVSGDTLLGTGMVVKLMDGNTVKASVTVVVTGDTNGDGQVMVTDLLAVKAHILAKSTLTGAAALAADTNGSGDISVTDFIQVKAAILGISAIVPN